MKRIGWGKTPAGALSQLVLKSIRSPFGQRTHPFGQFVSFGQFLLIVRSTCTHSGQLVLILVNLYSRFWSILFISGDPFWKLYVLNTKKNANKRTHFSKRPCVDLPRVFESLCGIDR